MKIKNKNKLIKNDYFNKNMPSTGVIEILPPSSSNNSTYSSNFPYSNTRKWVKRFVAFANVLE